MYTYHMYIYVGGYREFSTGIQHSWKTRSIDVSGYSGETTIKLEWRGYDTYDDFVGSGTGSGQALKIYQNGDRDTTYAVFRDLRFE